MLRKGIKIVLLILMIILAIGIIYSILLTRACIPLSFQLGINRKITDAYLFLRLKNIFGSSFPSLRVVADYPSQIYYLKDINIPENPGWPLIDYEHNLLFISVDTAYLNKFEEQARIHTISKGQYDQHALQLDDNKNAIEDMILLRLGDMWQQEAGLQCLYLKIYNNGIISFDYVWHDRGYFEEHLEWELHKISMQLPADREQIRSILKGIDFSIFERLHTIDAYYATLSWRAPGMAMVIKKGGKIKVVYRNPSFIVADELKYGLMEFWAEIIRKMMVRENVIKIIKSEYPRLLEERQVRDIESWLGIFDSKIGSKKGSRYPKNFPWFIPITNRTRSSP